MKPVPPRVASQEHTVYARHVYSSQSIVRPMTRVYLQPEFTELNVHLPNEPYDLAIPIIVTLSILGKYRETGFDNS